jgi:hypothetical protein
VSLKSLVLKHEREALKLWGVALRIAGNVLTIVDTSLKFGVLAKISGVFLKLACKTLNKRQCL